LLQETSKELLIERITEEEVAVIFAGLATQEIIEVSNRIGVDIQVSVEFQLDSWINFFVIKFNQGCQGCFRIY
jgi:methionine synthase II (cobalamin-independent)